jgi:hypothetical protein
LIAQTKLEQALVVVPQMVLFQKLFQIMLENAAARMTTSTLMLLVLKLENNSTTIE